MSGQIQYGSVESPTPDATPPVSSVPPGLFECAVRFGRRKADPYGHLVLTGVCVQFRGGRDLDVPWRQVAFVEHLECGLILSLHNTRRRLYFCCSTSDDAARGAAVARDAIAALDHRGTVLV